MDQWVKCLLDVWKTWIKIPSTNIQKKKKKKLFMMRHVPVTILWGQKQGDPRGLLASASAPVSFHKEEKPWKKAF